MHSHDYVELLIRQTPTPKGKSLTDGPVFHIIVQGTYNRTGDFHRIRLKQVLEASQVLRSPRTAGPARRREQCA